MMLKYVYPLILIILSFSWLPTPLNAQQPCASPSWEAKYYNTPDFSGAAVATSCDRAIEFSWGVSAPTSGVNFDNFSVRWTSTQNFPAAGIYQFTVTAEDAVRFYINGTPLINSINDTEGSRNLSANYTVNTAGSTAFLTLESINYTGNAAIKLVWSLTSGVGNPTPVPPQNTNTDTNTTENTTTVQNNTATPVSPTTNLIPFGQAPEGGGQPWTVEYFNSVDQTGAPLIASAPADGINQDYDLNSPLEGIPADNWSARWTRVVNFPAGVYTFSASADDRLTITINNVEILNQTEFVQNTIQTVQVQLPDGDQQMVVEYTELEGGANLFLTWTPAVGTTLLADGCNSVLAGKFGFPTTCQGLATNTLNPTTPGTVTMPVVVRAGPLYFRPQPSKAATALRTISRGESYSAIGRSNDLVWVQLIVDGVTGWSMSQYLTLQGDISTLPVTDGSQATNQNIPPTTGTNPLPPITETNPVETDPNPTVSGLQARALGNMRLREQPNNNSARVGSVDWGEIVSVLARSADGKWLLVSGNAGQGWTSREWYEILGDATTIPVAP